MEFFFPVIIFTIIILFLVFSSTKKPFPPLNKRNIPEKKAAPPFRVSKIGKTPPVSLFPRKELSAKPFSTPQKPPMSRKNLKDAVIFSEILNNPYIDR